MTKKCLKCGIEKTIDCFSTTSSYKCKIQYRGDCKECNSKSANEKYHEDPERFRKAARKWKKSNPQRVVDHKRWNMYRLRPGDYEALIQKQNNKCGICGCEMEFPHIDHDHLSGKVRGILCSTCNTGLGKFGDSLEHLQKAIDYLKINS